MDALALPAVGVASYDVGEARTERGARHDDTGVFAPVVEAVLADLLDAADHQVGRCVLVGDIEQVAHDVRRDLVTVAGRLLVRTLLGRLHEQRAAGRLVGRTSRERFCWFVARTASAEGVTALERDLPDLIAHARGTAGLRLRAVLDLLAETGAAWERIHGALPGPTAQDRIVGLDLGAGDTHGLGRSVVVLRLTSGARVVVKPRDLRVERGVGRLLDLLAERTGAALRHPATVLGERHGWVEHVERGRPGPDWHTGCGVILAGLYLLDATDVHYENLLTDAAGRPVLVDAEAVLTPRLTQVAADVDAEPRLQGVLATGLLSVPMPGETLDAGALSYRPGTSPYGTWRAVRPGHDDMALEMVCAQVHHPGPAEDLPRGPRERALVVESFRAAVTWAITHHDAWAAAVRRELGEGSVRLIHRPTMLYAQVLRAATHPAFAVHAGRRRRILGRMAVLGPTTTPWEIVASEIRQLWVGDLPSFAVPTTGNTVIDGHGTDTGVACRPPLDHTLAASARVGRAALEAQIATIETALGEW